MDERRQQRIVGNRNAPRRNPIWLFGLFVIALIALALGEVIYFQSNKQGGRYTTAPPGAPAMPCRMEYRNNKMIQARVARPRRGPITIRLYRPQQEGRRKPRGKPRTNRRPGAASKEKRSVIID